MRNPMQPSWIAYRYHASETAGKSEDRVPDVLVHEQIRAATSIGLLDATILPSHLDRLRGEQPSARHHTSTPKTFLSTTKAKHRTVSHALAGSNFRGNHDIAKLLMSRGLPTTRVDRGTCREN